MKIFFLLIFSCIGLSLLSAQEKVSFENQVLGLAFVGNANWSNVSDSGSMIYELQNRNHNLNLKMWRVNVNDPVQEYLPEFIDNEGMSILQGPFQTIIDDQIAYGLIAMCNEKRQPVKMLFIAFQTQGGINLIRFKCPDECFHNHRKLMNELIKGIKIVDKSESYLVLANHSIVT